MMVSGESRRALQEEALDFFCAPRCVSGHESGAPRPTEQIETRDVASFENEIDNAADILDRSVTANDRTIGLRFFSHLPRSSRTAISAQVEQINIVATRYLDSRASGDAPQRLAAFLQG